MGCTVQVSAQKLMYIMCMRSHYLGKEVNCVADQLYDEAMACARHLDEHGPPKGEARLLEGLPVSIKDSIGVKGHDSTCGMAVRCFKPVHVRRRRRRGIGT